MNTTRRFAVSLFTGFTLMLGFLNTGALAKPGPGGQVDATAAAWWAFERSFLNIFDPKKPVVFGGVAEIGLARIDRHIAALRQLNLTPDFTLSIEQRKNIKTVADEWRAAYEKFQKDSTDAVVQWRKAASEALKAKDAKKLEEARQQRDALAAKAPDGRYIARIKATLTADQVKALDAKIKELDEREQARIDAFEHPNIKTPDQQAPKPEDTNRGL